MGTLALAGGLAVHSPVPIAYGRRIVLGCLPMGVVLCATLAGVRAFSPGRLPFPRGVVPVMVAPVPVASVKSPFGPEKETGFQGSLMRVAPSGSLVILRLCPFAAWYRR